MGGRPGPVSSLLQNNDETLDTQPLQLGAPGQCCSGLQAGGTEGHSVWPIWPTLACDSLCEQLASKCPVHSRSSVGLVHAPWCQA